jgi:superfamily II DNA or RNA helicase
MLTLRDYQEESIRKLREGFAAGKKAQMLYLATGGGKSEVAAYMLDKAREKGNRSAMILDRVVLVNQMSERLDKYEIRHGVLQSGHWRFRPYEHIQVCSAQTVEKRGHIEGLTLLVIDEAHCTRAQTLEFIKQNPQIRVIGLSATPFTKGLGKTYDGIVSVCTTKQLVDQGVLVPLKVFISKEVDMTGAKKVAGEWSGAEAGERGIKIVGDVVAEWAAMTHRVFGRPAKTIVFSSGVAHGTELSRKFQEQGYNFVCVSYKDDSDFKRELIADFQKPDTEIHGLIATDILTKGFDCPDVLIGVSARPFARSLSSHIQQMGRVMRGSPGKEFGLWLDFSGNYLRFREDWEGIYENGVNSLDDGAERVKKEPTPREKEDSKCPGCKILWVRGWRSCGYCGFVREKPSMVESIPGEMEELAVGTRDDKQIFWSMCRYKVMIDGWSPGRAAHTYREKYNVWPRKLDDEKILCPDEAFEKFCQKLLNAFLRKVKRK